MGEALAKAPSGIAGLDELLMGGVPQGRPTLVCGGPGCGKTLLATSFLVHGAESEDESGVFISFDERTEDLAINSSSLGYDLDGLVERGRLALDYVHLDRNELEESGAFDLEGLFVRIDLAVRTVGARRVVLDTIDTLFAGLPNEAIVRSELRRLFRWLKDRGLTTIVTGEQGEKSFSRNGIEEYVSDCVILLDHRVQEQVSTRRLRVVKYRGTTHGTNEYPFLIGKDGISVLPITSLGLTHAVSDERVPTGVAGLDALLEGRGFFKGSSVLISGGPGGGKTALSAHILDAACARNESCVYFGFEESPRQLIRHMRSIGLDLGRWIDKGLLRCDAARMSEYGLETHLVAMHAAILDHRPSLVVVDPVSALLGSDPDLSRMMVLRLVDYLKGIGVTSVFLNLQSQVEHLVTELEISSMMDSWLLLLTEAEQTPARRLLRVVKSRGMSHPLSPQPMEITAHGVRVTAPDRQA